MWVREGTLGVAEGVTGWTSAGEGGTRLSFYYDLLVPKILMMQGRRVSHSHASDDD